MGALNYHIEGFVYLFKQLSKGKYLLYFLPGVIVSLFFGFIFFITNSLEGSSVSFFDSALGFIELIVEQIFIFTVVTLLSPFNSALSEKFDTDLTGQSFVFSLGRLLKDFLRMIVLSFLLVLMEFGLIGIIWLLTKLLGLGSLNPYVFFFLSSFFVGIAFYDASLERHIFGISRSLSFATKHWFSMFLTGVFFQLIFIIPFIGIFTAPVIATMLGTYVFLKQKDKQ
jgi:uncharacterized protein involved in cysteine biosynthesis